MKQILSHLTVIFCLVILIQSCKKDNTTAQNPQTINVTIKSGEGYNYDLGFFGDEEGAKISKQALHYDVSTAERKSNGDNVIYYYKSLPGYIGTDEVELKSERGSDGASPNVKVIFTIIKFIIIN